MRKSIILLISLATFISCNNSASKDTPEEDSLAMEEELLPEERIAWVTEYDSIKNEYVLKQQRKLNPETLTPQAMIADINAAWNEIKLEFRKISNDTLYVAIPKSDYLTQQMGSSGSSEYMATTTFNLTELKGIRYVNYDFIEGDHLSPGTFSRDNFKDFQ
jgi:hypothetical protein